MQPRGIEFGRVWGASGVQGFFGEGYKFHNFFKPFGLDFRGMTFVAKTTTWAEKKGNMPLDWRHRPTRLFPVCIKVNHREGVVLNSVGLSGPGASALFAADHWQRRRDPFFLSFMSVGPTLEDRQMELKKFVQILKLHLPCFEGRDRVGLQINYSCPNTGLHLEELAGEVWDGLTIASALGMPLIPKFNVLLPVESAMQIAEHKACDGICMSNTIPWGLLPERIPWERYFGSSVSPLADLGGGGLSGRPLLPIVAEWIAQARKAGFQKHINGGGGILCFNDALRLFRAGASSVALGSVAILRPWRVQTIISQVNEADLQKLAG